MTIDITNPAVIERQHHMRGCGLTLDQIAKLMAATDEEIEKAIIAGHAAVAAAEGDKYVRAVNLLRAFQLENDMRLIAVMAA